ncbi:MAG: peptidoglycan-binding protein [Aureispira sp.]|nr:peptidoglycan-binding protein [Aureispira sp.]
MATPNEQQLQELRKKIIEWVELYKGAKGKVKLPDTTLKYLETIKLVLPNVNAAIKKQSGAVGREQGNTTASKTLGAAVGKGGKNKKADVLLIQQLLNQKESAGLVEDGAYGNNTLNAIKTFQKSIFNGWADGLISVGGTTWNKLSAGSSTPVETVTTEEETTVEETTLEETVITAEVPSNPNEISAAVGECSNGNLPEDVKKAQTLLNKVGAKLTVSGNCDAATIAAIHRFQASVFGGWSDGCIDAGKTTWKKLVAGKGSAAEPVGNLGPAGNEITNLAGKMIASVPKDAQGALNLVILFGGASYANPEWMMSQTPQDFFKKALVLIAPQRTGYSKAQKAADTFFKAKGLEFAAISIAGFSGGGQDVQLASGSFKAVGLIDPYTVSSWAKKSYGSNVCMEYRVANWGMKYADTRKSLPVLAQSIRNGGGHAAEVEVAHKNFPSTFLNKYKSKFL